MIVFDELLDAAEILLMAFIELPAHIRIEKGGARQDSHFDCLAGWRFFMLLIWQPISLLF